MAARLHVIGLGVDVPVQLNERALAALRSADRVIGWDRHQPLVTPLLNEPERFVCVQKLSELNSHVSAEQAGTVAIVASGDPLFYGIGRWIGQAFGDDAIEYHPAVSSVQAACHQEGVSLQDATVVSLHGRPLSSLNRYLTQLSALVILTDQHSQPQALAQACVQAGFGDSIIGVHEDLGYEQQRSRRFTAHELLNRSESFSPLHVSIVHVRGRGGVFPAFPGIPDEAFQTGAEPGKGMISKREVRLAILSLLQPSAGDVVWDIGAGCGGVSVELARWNTATQVYAVEHHAQRLEYLEHNRRHFGVVQNLHIVPGTAPEALSELPLPNKIFIGGSDGALTELLALAWGQLPPGGVLMASAVMEPTKVLLRDYAAQQAAALPDADIEIVEVGVKRGRVQNTIQWVPKLPVEIYKLVKPYA